MRRAWLACRPGNGTATIKGEQAKNSQGQIKPFKITGWVRAHAFG